MSVREIPSGEWQTFLEQFSRDHRAWLATVERVRGGRRPHVAAAGRPLASVTPEVDTDRIVGIAIEFQQDARDGGAVRVRTPKRLRVDETAQGTARVLEIEDDRGDLTLIRFRAAPLPEALDGLAPGETYIGNSGGGTGLVGGGSGDG
jgi:hypothetical protein